MILIERLSEKKSDKTEPMDVIFLYCKRTRAFIGMQSAGTVVSLLCNIKKIRKYDREQTMGMIPSCPSSCLPIMVYDLPAPVWP